MQKPENRDLALGNGSLPMFTKAQRKSFKIRLALVGPSGSGKSFTSLAIAKHLSDQGEVVVIDSENGSSLRYADNFEFFHCSLRDARPSSYSVALIEAQKIPNVKVIIIDSFSHCWLEILNMVDGFFSWKDVRPMERKLMSEILNCKCHLIVTMRTKTEWAIGKDSNTGKPKPIKVGLGPVQNQNVCYEFDLMGDLDPAHSLTITKSRCPELDNRQFHLPTGEKIATILRNWCGEDEPYFQWTSEEDAIKWAMTMADWASEEDVRKAWESVEPVNGKKAPAWVNQIREMAKFSKSSRIAESDF